MGRRPRLAVAVALSAVVALAGSPGSGAEAPERILGTAKVPLGVSGIDATHDDFAAMARAGVRVYRFVLPQHIVQGPGGHYDWTRIDEIVRGAARNRITLLPILHRGKRARPQPPVSPQALRRWDRFVAAAVGRYGARGSLWSLSPLAPVRPIVHWQVWNEPNLDFYWSDPSPAAYTALLRRTAAVIREADAEARIVLAGLNGLAGPRSIDANRFLRRLYANGAAPHFDIAAVHPYARTPFGARRKTASFARIVTARDRGAPIWVTEVGWSTSGPADHKLVTDRGGQARKLAAVMRKLRRLAVRRPIGLILWYSWRDRADNGCGWCGGTGLLERDGSSKPSLSGFKLAGL